MNGNTDHAFVLLPGLLNLLTLILVLLGLPLQTETNRSTPNRPSCISEAYSTIGSDKSVTEDSVFKT